MNFEEWLQYQQFDPKTRAERETLRAAYEATRPTQADRDESR